VLFYNNVFIKRKENTMFKRILVPIDYSEDSEKAAMYALSLAAKLDSYVYILHVLDERLIDAAFFDSVATEHDRMKLHKVREKSSLVEMEKLCKKMSAKAPDLKIVEKVVRGIAFVEIVQFARKHDVDLIVMGSHGRTNLINMLLGSTTEKVVRKAHCNVLTVRPHEREFVLP